ncbi:hypothetical protein K438DRAFT_1749917 [Mycena galopus ATCC 62051]|nr:hypothetical protein K438DRAFT_1749917 [Mycena galopus ATCC 62051]
MRCQKFRVRTLESQSRQVPRVKVRLEFPGYTYLARMAWAWVAGREMETRGKAEDSDAEIFRWQWRDGGRSKIRRTRISGYQGIAEQTPAASPASARNHLRKIGWRCWLAIVCLPLGATLGYEYCGGKFPQGGSQQKGEKTMNCHASRRKDSNLLLSLKNSAYHPNSRRRRFLNVIRGKKLSWDPAMQSGGFEPSTPPEYKLGTHK